MLVVITGELIGENKMESTGKVQKRNILPGGTINILCVLKLWSKSIETVTASEAVETYAVSEVDFSSLFNGGVHEDTFRNLQIKESFNYQMDKSKVSDDAPMGRPL
jgi:hypothetical protein